MIKLIKHPFDGAEYPSKIQIVYDSTSFSDVINMAVSIAKSIQSAGRKVTIFSATEVDSIYWIGWQNDQQYDTYISISRPHDLSSEITDEMLVIYLYSSSDEYNMQSVCNLVGHTNYIGLSSPFVYQDAQLKLDATNELLLYELEKLLPADNAVKQLRDLIRSGGI